MVHLFKKLCILSIVFILFSLHSAAQGRDVYVFLKDGTQYFGELLAVRDSVIITSQVVVKDDERMVEIADFMQPVFFKDIDSIYIKGYTPAIYPAGMQVGGSMGGLAGYKAGEEKGFGTALLYSIGGTIVGGLFGAGIDWTVKYCMSDDAVIFAKVIVSDSVKLKAYSRFENTEPIYMRDIIDNLLKETK